MQIRKFLRLLAVCAALGLSGAVCAAASNIGETTDIQFNDVTAPDLGAKADALWTHVALYEYVRNNYDFIAYQGARSGSINTFLGGRGNDVDLAATLIAMFRRVYIPARYAVGTVHLPSAQVMNWLQVKNADLAASILKDQGIQAVVISTDKSTIDFEHTWVEALVPYENYRGAGVDSTVDCSTTPASCHWVSLDPSFKQYVSRSSGLDPYTAISFNYDAYYKALLNNSALRDKNPLDIYENSVTDWLRGGGAAQGKNLDDISDFLNIVKQEEGLLPASLPFATVGTIRRYNSADDHDAMVPGTEAKKWMKNVTVQAKLANGTVIASASVSLVEASTQRFTFMYDTVNTYRQIFRLDGTEVGTPVTFDTNTTFNTPITLSVSMDGPPGTGGSADLTITADYDAMLGGAYYIATGGETSNWSQVHRAAQELLTANQNYPVYFNAAESGCDMQSKQGCTPYIDPAFSLRLIDSGAAMDALTGGLLQVAGTQFYAQLREKLGRLDALQKTKTPIGGFIGVVSSTFGDVEYIDGTAYSVLPGGLLVDMKGLQLLGSWRVDQAAAYSNPTVELFGHIMSSLEHETWQQLTGYDAISTVRGIQLALANGATQLNPVKNASSDTLPSLYSSFGYAATPPSGFAQHQYTLFGQNYLAWGYTGGNPNAEFAAFRTNTQGIAAGDARLKWWTLSGSDGVDAFFSNYDTWENTLLTEKGTEGQLKTNLNMPSTISNYSTQDVVSATVDSPTGFAVGSFARTSSSAYNYVVNETTNHINGTYPISLYIKLAGAVNEQTNNYTGLAGATMISATVAGPAGFAVKSFSKAVAADTLPLVLKETSAHAPGVYNVSVNLSWLQNSMIYSSTVTPQVEVVGGRWVLASGTIPVGSIDTSDNTSLTCGGLTYTGTPTTLLSNLQTCFNNAVTLNGLQDYLTAFEPSGSFVYRAMPAATDAQPTPNVVSIRDDLYQAALAQYWIEYQIPSRLSYGPNYRFSVDIRKVHATSDGSLLRTTYEIQNEYGINAGGGYVLPITGVESDVKPLTATPDRK
jgi:hypothetical protein